MARVKRAQACFVGRRHTCGPDKRQTLKTVATSEMRLSNGCGGWVLIRTPVGLPGCRVLALTLCTLGHSGVRARRCRVCLRSSQVDCCVDPSLQVCLQLTLGS